MTLPGPGNSLNIAQINAEFGYGFNLDAYRGKVWYLDNGQSGIFPIAPNAISFNDFYSKRAANPVTPTTQTFTSDGVFVTPAVYTVMTVIVRAGGGGAGGANGAINCGAVQAVTLGSDGLYGGTSSFGAYAVAYGGGGGRGDGTTGPNGSPYCDGIPSGGPAYSGGGAGGAGGYHTVVLVSPSSGGVGPNPGEIITVTVGAGGIGGVGGANSQLMSGVCTVIGNSTKGQNGTAGSIVIQWT